MSQPLVKLRNRVVNALSEYQMLEEGDKVLVAVSGGIDSTVLLSTLIDIYQRAPFKFSLQPILVDHKLSKINTRHFLEWINQLGFQLEILECDTSGLIEKSLADNKSPCLICSRLRRGALYTYAKKHHYTKIALGHNRDDLNETILLNMFYSGRLASMPPKLRANDGVNTIIRPLCYVSKDLIMEYGKQLNAPLIENAFCKKIPDNARYQIRQLLRQLEETKSGIGNNLLAAQSNIIPSQLMDKRFWDFNF